MEQKWSVNILLATVTTCFALFFFALQDMGARMIYVCVFLGAVVLLQAVLRPKITVNRIHIAYFCLAITSLLFFSFPNALHDYDVASVIIEIFLCFLLSCYAKPGERELKGLLQFIIAFAFVLSLYVIIVTIFPDIYYRYISRFIAEGSRRTTEHMFGVGYGVIIGGNPTLVNHILVLSQLILLNQYFILNGNGRKGKFKNMTLMIITLCAMFFENRKGELLTFLMVAFYAIFFHLPGNARERMKRGLKYGVISLLLLLVIVIVALKLGLANRYTFFFERLSDERPTDISSGRLYLWKVAISKFLEYPFLGVGWGNIRNYVYMHNSASDTDIHNVHNLILQLLSETGIIGCFMFMLPVTVILIEARKTVHLLRRAKNSRLPRLLANVAFEYQLFLLLNGLLDSTWHRLSFWPFYAVSIIFAVAAVRMYSKSKADLPL